MSPLRMHCGYPQTYRPRVRRTYRYIHIYRARRLSHIHTYRYSQRDKHIEIFESLMYVVGLSSSATSLGQPLGVCHRCAVLRYHRGINNTNNVSGEAAAGKERQQQRIHSPHARTHAETVARARSHRHGRHSTHSSAFAPADG